MQTKFKGIKKSIKILIIALSAFFLITAVPAVLLQFSRIQSAVVHVITRNLSENLHTTIDIGRVDYRFFNRLTIEDIYIEDLQQDTLLSIKKIHTGFDFFKLIKGKIAFSDLIIDRLHAHIITDPFGNTNYSFLFQPKTEPQPTLLDLRLEELEIIESEISYTELADSINIRQEIVRQITFGQIHSAVSINILTNDTINASIKHLKAIEQSGFGLSNLSLQVIGSPKNISFPVFQITLPNSEINLDNLSVVSDSLESDTHFTNRYSVLIPVKDTRIALSDISAWVPEFVNIHDAVSLSATISGKLSSLRFKDVKASFGKTILMNASLDISGLPNVQEAFIYGSVNKMQASTYEVQDVISKIGNMPFVFSDEIHRLGRISFRGNISGFMSDLVAFGNFNTKVGNISSDISLRFENNLRDLTYNGALKTNKLSVGALLNDTSFGNIAIKLSTQGIKTHNEPFKGSMKGVFSEFEMNNYRYTNAEFDGKYDGNGFNGKFNIKDENIDAEFLGIIDFKDPEVPVFDFDLTVNNTDLHALNIIKDYPDSKLSFRGISKLNGRNLDNLNGVLMLQDITFTNNNQTLNANDFIFTSKTEVGHTFFSIRSDYLNGSFIGNFKYSSIGHTFEKLLTDYLPATSKNNGKNDKKKNNNKNKTPHLPNVVSIDLSLQNTSEISHILALPYEISGNSIFQGEIDENTGIIDLLVRLDTLKTEKQLFENLSLRVDNTDNKLLLVGRTQLIDQFSDVMNIYLSSEASEDNVLARLMWQNNLEVTNAGEINAKAKLKKVNNALSANIFIRPSQIIISDSIWHIRASDIDFYADSLICINNFLFENDQQFIHIDGRASHDKTDSLTLKMNDLNLDYLMSLLRLQGVSFGGFITGNLKLFNLLEEPILLGNLYADNFSINDSLVADGYLSSTWDKEYNRLIILGDFINDAQEEVAQATAYYVPKADSLDIYIDAKQFPLAFLNQYFVGVANNFGGKAAGDLRIYGPVKNILFDGEVDVTDGRASIDLLNTSYSFNDRVKLSPYKIHLDNIKLKDSDKNEATLNGHIDHNGSFQDMVYDVTIHSNKILGLNTTSNGDDFFYGKAYVGGLVKIFGNDSEANIVINGTSQPGTKCYMSMMTASTAMENDFITFGSLRKNQYVVELPTGRRTVNQTPFNVKVDMQIEVTPEAEIDILVDTRAGDKITGRGSGDIRVKFDTYSDAEVFGTIELEQSYYLFTLQTVIRKEFKINEGSTLTWAGNPFEAEVDITGYYPLTASLTDLIEGDELRQITSRSTVPVHCILHLTDDLMSPTIKFDIDLPSSDESVKSRVRNIINTEEMMNRQILYLILFHKFFTPENIRATAVGVNEGISLAMASGSAQINNYLQNILNSNVVSLGFDWQKADVESDEVKAQILIQPNNRLIINGNIGYRNDNISENKFIGDFDLEYKLIESGRLRFTAYNHTIDRAQLREAKTTQGVGLIYREDFNTVPEMFVYYWDLIKGIFRKKGKKAETAQAPE